METLGADVQLPPPPSSLQFPPPWFTKTSLPDWIQLQNQRHKLGKRKMKRRHKVMGHIACPPQLCITKKNILLSHNTQSQQALQRIASTKACFSYEEVRESLTWLLFALLRRHLRSSDTNIFMYGCTILMLLFFHPPILLLL